jgi:SAM-dependent methyltransferase
VIEIAPHEELDRAHYEVEIELAERLRRSTKEERLGGLYASVYAERLERIPQHPLLVRARDIDASARATSPQLRLLAPLLTPHTVFMELGPGDCALALAVAWRVDTVYAVDVSHDLVSETDLPSNFHLLTSNGVCVPVPEASVHLAYSNQVLEHVHPDDVEDHLREIRTALAPGGRFICITPNRLSGPWDVSRAFDDTATGLHLKEYTISEQIDLLRNAGFDVGLFASYRGHYLWKSIPHLPIRSAESLIERLPRRLRRNVASALVAVKLIARRPLDDGHA